MPTSSESVLGLITPELMSRFPAATYLLGKQAGSEAGIDVSDPRNVMKAVQSRTAADRMSQATEAQSKRDDRVLQRVLGTGVKPFGIAAGQGTVEQNMTEGARVSEDALTRTMAARSAVGRENLRETQKLAEFARMDTAIDAREKKLKDKVLQGIERNILDVKNKALASRAILRSTLGGLSPAQRNAVLAAQGAAFTEQLNNLDALRQAREGAIDDRVASDRESLESQIKASEQRMKGLEGAVKIMEQNGADAASIADIRVKLAQEKEKLRKKGNGTVTRSDIVYSALFKNFQTSHANRMPNEQEVKELRRQAEQISENKRFDALIDSAQGVAPAPIVGGTPAQRSVIGTARAGSSADVHLGGALEFSGFGIPPSRQELADLDIQESTRLSKRTEAGR